MLNVEKCAKCWQSVLNVGKVGKVCQKWSNMLNVDILF